MLVTFVHLMKRKSYCIYFALALFSLGLLSTAPAITLDWGTNADWDETDGTPYEDSFDIDPDNAGDDVAITIGGSTGSLIELPNDTGDFTGGISGNTSLNLVARYDPDVDQSIIVTIEFNYSQDVTEVSFSIYDVDLTTGRWIDRISSFEAWSGGVLQTTIFPTLTGSSANMVNNAGTTDVEVIGTDTAVNSQGTGNVLVDFGDAVFDEIRFTWTNEDPALLRQGIGLHNITYTPAPEPSTVLTGGLLVGLIGFQVLRRKKKSDAKVETPIV
jgi:hypothetical protein